MAEAFVNGRPDDRVSIGDRGLRYGDGVFETLLLAGDTCPLWQYHMARLSDGCLRLGLTMPDAGALLAECLALADVPGFTVVRVTVTRGPGGSGYFPPDESAGTRIVQRVARSQDHPARPGPGLDAIWCQTRLARQPALAGLKHLNRLEQILAARECQAARVPEGLLRDTGDLVVEAVSSNLLLDIDGEIVTPVLDQCGVRGVGLAWLMDQAACTIRQRPVPAEEARQARHLMVVNSVRGIRPIVRLDGAVLDPGPRCRELQELWNRM